MSRVDEQVSVIIPVRDGELYLAEAIESVLIQNCPPGEILVVDDGSTDRSAAIAKGYLPRVRYLRQANAGAGAAKNTGIAASRGGLLAFLDADDVWLPGKLDAQQAVLRSDPRIEAVSGHVQQFVSPEVGPQEMSGVRCASAPLPGHLTSALLVARDAFERVGWFAEDCPANDFTEWWVRARERNLRLHMLAEVVVRRRLHRGNLGRTAPGARSDLPRILKASLDRRRAGAGISPAPATDGAEDP